MMVTEQLIKNAFSNSGDDLFFSYESLGINGANGMCWIQCRFKRSGSLRNNDKRKRCIDFCSFKDVNECDRMEEMEQGNDQREQSTLNNSSLFCRQFNVPDDVCQNLRDMLIDLQADKDRRGRKKARDQKGKRRTKNEMKNRRTSHSLDSSDCSPPIHALQIPQAGDQQQNDNDSMDCRTECDDVLESARGETINLRYEIGGRTGTIVIDSKTCLTLDDLMKNLLPAVEYDQETDSIEGEDEKKARNYSRGYEQSDHGKNECWIPRGTELMDLRTVKTLRTYHQQMCAFRRIFKGKQCRIPYDSLRIFVAGSITGYGCSDEAAIMMMGCTFKLLIHMMGIMDITNEIVAYALPSRANQATSEHRLAADCVIVSRQEIKND